ncbi:helix-turn-helix domain-containing protein [Pseudonocardia bannensis]|uniref:HTH cro/C1-type domain-containing protein n=1 Tax=Pseudonocardia bannensis TaxID=630973 RepID=A0A848DLZ6_9PSEU|nr:helix-turn-helix domain-containing protein [Pseudonocardia bannensis]NMH93563.1 hypothetical protein [Pseudonocardia bannensis]
MARDRPAAQTAANRERQRELYGAPLGDRVHRLTGLLGITQARLAGTLGISPAMLSQLVSARRVKIGDPAVLARLMLLDERCPHTATPPDAEALDALLAEVRAAQLQWAVPVRPHARLAAGAAHPDPDEGPVRHRGHGAVAPAPLRPDADPIRHRGHDVVPGRPAGPTRLAGHRPRTGNRSVAPPVPRPPSGVQHGPRSAAEALRAVAGPSRLVAAAAALDPAFPELADLLRRAAGRPVAR